MPITPRLIPAPLLAALLLLAGCDYERPGTWRATGVNDANLAAMLAEPGHAVRGVAAPNERGQPASAAVWRLERGRRPPLPDSRASNVGNISITPPPSMQGSSNGQ
jgi:hypothetical protein